jgi:soluble lytic murein transglycosylase-like protein
MDRIVTFLLLGLVVLLAATRCDEAQARSLFDDRYDAAIEKAVKRWWPDIPLPNLLKAQLYQESRLDPDAVSHVGARGLGQFMPRTWDEVVRELSLGPVSPHMAEPAIDAAAYYMAKQRRFPDWRGWSDPDRHRMAQAAYNAGAGNIRKALRRCAGTTYASAIACLPAITGRHSKETITYVDRIARWFQELEARL